MLTLQDYLTGLFQEAIVTAFGAQHAGVDPVVRVAGNAQHGDYQVNAAMALAKVLGAKPREVAEKIVAAIAWEGVCANKPEIAGPGFINVRLSEETIKKHLQSVQGDAARAGAPKAAKPIKVVVDYSGPNVAKEMHVGHLRSSVIGDAIARVLIFKGHDVVRQNHLGDWGTQFGMLIENLLETNPEQKGLSKIGDLNKLYKESKKRFDADPEFALRARARVVSLQSGDGETLAVWQHLIEQSKLHFNDIYKRLDVELKDSDIRAESFYNPLLPDAIKSLELKGLARLDEGAMCCFPEGYFDREKKPLGMIVRKSDGGYPYAATDLAGLRYRVQELKAERVIYFTDARQAQHFAMVFWVARAAGWVTPGVKTEHVPFGSVLGQDGKPYKTREGDPIRLVDLLDEAQARAAAAIASKKRDVPLEEAEANDIALAVGIGAMKYADLASDRIKDYVFDWDRMLAFEGNTGPYVQNAIVRVRSIFRKAGVSQESAIGGEVKLVENAERGLALKLLHFPGVVDAVEVSLEPHRLCGYLFELATCFHQFYEQCPVLKSDVPEELKASRLALAACTDRVLALGLGLIGVRTVDRM
jgi:arginyl-tRNA synthetase